MKLDSITMDDLLKSKSKKYIYFVLAVIFMISYSLVPFIGRGSIIASIVGITSFIVTIISFIYLFKLYGVKSKEGWIWLLFILGLVLMIFSRIADLSDHTLAYFILRLSAKPTLIIGLLMKLNISGIDLGQNEKTILSITFAGWWLLVFISSLVPALYRGFDYRSDMFAIFAITEVFALMVACIILLTIKAKGWYFFALGVVLISMGDIFYMPAEEYGLIYPGSPISLFWYLGLLLTAYGAYHLRREYLEMIAI